jgi:hypothetical protein
MHFSRIRRPGALGVTRSSEVERRAEKTMVLLWVDCFNNVGNYGYSPQFLRNKESRSAIVECPAPFVPTDERETGYDELPVTRQGSGDDG